MSAKTKKIISAVVIIALLVVLGITWLKNRNAEPDPHKEETGFSVETMSETASESETEAPTESVTETETEAPTESVTETETETETEEPSTGLTVEKNGQYSDKESVALYIHTYGRLPSNYITKDEAEGLGWVSSKGNLWKVAKGKSIGGSYFGNYEGLLPKKSGRKYYECDIDYGGGYRNEKRIIYSNDGLVFYTEDHYKSFEQLY